jgi:outer membrane protein OmpA-like peptidoglycan-associated protein
MTRRRVTWEELHRGIELQTGIHHILEVSSVFHARLTGMLFDFDRTFLLPGALHGIRALKEYYDEHAELSVLIVGHTDSKGEPAYNVALSKERAQVLAWFLRDDVDGWMSCYRSGRPAGKTWGTREDQHMLSALAGYDGNIDGKAGARTQETVKRFQGEAGLSQSGEIDDATRKALMTKYLQQDGTTLPEGTSLTVHGSGAHNPVADEESGGDEARRRNRRVEIFLSDGSMAPAPGAPDGPEYTEWVRQAIETVDLGDLPDELIKLELELPRSLFERLPGDVELTLSGAHVPTQKKDRSAAVASDDRVRFEFRWVDKEAVVDLVASGGGAEVTLLKEQRIGDLETDVEWSDDLETLCAEPEEVEVTPSDEPTNPGAMDDERPDDSL